MIRRGSRLSIAYAGELSGWTRRVEQRCRIFGPTVTNQNFSDLATTLGIRGGFGDQHKIASARKLGSILGLDSCTISFCDLDSFFGFLGTLFFCSFGLDSLLGLRSTVDLCNGGITYVETSEELSQKLFDLGS